MSSNGLITVASRFSVSETLDRLTTALMGAGLRVFARINHASNAGEVGLSLRPTELLIFGHPKDGTPLMQDKQKPGQRERQIKPHHDPGNNDVQHCLQKNLAWVSKIA